MKNIIHTLCIITIIIYLTFSLAPDWAKFLVIDGIKMSERSIPFYMSIRFDKPLLGLFILFLFGFGFQPLKVTQVLKTGLMNSFYVIALLIGVAISISYVEWDPKLPYETGLFMLNNLLIVCIALTNGHKY